jgi:uridine kinase
MAYMVGIVGGTCSGKTTLLSSIKKMSPADTVFLSLENYFVQNAEQHPINTNDWESPGYLLLDTLVADLQRLRLSSNAVVIAEGYLLLCTPALRELFDTKIYIDLPANEMIRRRLNRKGDKPWDQPTYIKESLAALHEKYVLSQRQYAEHLLDGRESRQALLAQALGLIHDDQQKGFGLKDLIYRNKPNLVSKLQRFRSAGPGSIHAIFDFDRTMTTGVNPGEDITTWHILDNHLAKDGRVRADALFKKYRQLEIKGFMTEEDAYEWWSQHLDLFVEYGTNISDIKQSFVQAAKLRSGIGDLAMLCKKLDIPIIILSAGVKEVIEVMNQHNGITSSHLIATRLRYSSDGRIVGWDRDTLVHAFNKLHWSRKELDLYRKDRPYTILVGDGLEDAKMAQGHDNVLRIRIYDPRKDEPDNISTFTNKSFDAGFDLVVGSDIVPLARLCRQILVKRANHIPA